MTEIRFQLQQTPENKWRLKERRADMLDENDEPMWIERGLYDSPDKGAEAVKILLSPKIINFDPNGDEIR